MANATHTGSYLQEVIQVDKEGNVMCVFEQLGLHAAVFYVQLTRNRFQKK